MNMKNIATLIFLLLFAGCASNSKYEEMTEEAVSEAILKHAISTWQGCFGCDVRFLFLGVEGKTLGKSFLENFNYPNLLVSSQENTESNCEKGIVDIKTQLRGYAFTVFELKKLNENTYKAKWGHWYSCKSYSYNYTILKKENTKWRVKKTSVHS